MEKITSLNNTQRKMLDDAYMDEFDKIKKIKLDDRKFEETKNINLILKKENKDKKITKFLNNYNSLVEQYKKTKTELSEKGLRIDNISNYSNEAKLVFDSYGNQHPEVRKEKDKTFNLELELEKKRREIRAKIYGMDMSYEDIKKDIDDCLKSI